MSPEIAGLLGLLVLMALLFLRVWIGFAMAFVGLTGYVYLEGWARAAVVIGSEPYVEIASLTFITLPLFVLMGAVISSTGLGGDLYDSASKWFGGIRGGLAAASVVACTAFSAVSGSSTATALTIGKVAFPQMKRYKYDERLAAGSCAAGGTIGILIPPSLAFIVYGLITQQSIGKLFMAGLIPGLLQATFYMVTIYVVCRLRPHWGPAAADTVRPSLKEKISSLRLSGPVTVIFLSTIGGIYLGVFTPTEAGAVGAFASIVVSMIARRMGKREFGDAIKGTIEVTAMIVPMFVGAFILMRFLAVSKLPFMLSDFLVDMGIGKTEFMALVIVFYLLVGCFLDVNSAIMLTLPIIFPTVQTLGIDPIWFGVIVVRLNEIGLLTPPIGLNAFVISGAFGIPAGTVFRGVSPFLLADVAHLALLIAIPELSLYLAGAL